MAVATAWQWQKRQHIGGSTVVAAAAQWRWWQQWQQHGSSGNSLAAA
jgi:hypothetical protein